MGGGIYTKAADVGADLVGKVEQGIPEDDPRNPAIIADNVGDNVGDVAGMGADLFESYSGSIIAASALGAGIALATGSFSALVTLPFVIASVGIIASIIGSFLVKTKEGATQQDLLNTLRKAIYGASLIVLVLAAVIVVYADAGWRWWLVILLGLLAGNAIAYSTEYFTSYDSRPTQSIAKASETGSATLIIQGLSVGMMSTVAPALIVAVTIILSFVLGMGATAGEMSGGLYAVAIAGVGMLSTLGVTLASDAYGPVADNAGGIAEMSDLPRRGARPHGRPGQPGQHDGGHGQGFRHRFRRADGAGVDGRLRGSGEARQPGLLAEPAGQDHAARHHHRRHDALSLLGPDHDGCRQGGL